MITFIKRLVSGPRCVSCSEMATLGNERCARHEAICITNIRGIIFVYDLETMIVWDVPFLSIF